MSNIKIKVIEHTWLDMSKSWFVKINDVKSGGEITSLSEAENIAKDLAKKIGGEFDNTIYKSNEFM